MSSYLIFGICFLLISKSVWVYLQFKLVQLKIEGVQLEIKDVQLKIEHQEQLLRYQFAFLENQNRETCKSVWEAQKVGVMVMRDCFAICLREINAKKA